MVTHGNGETETIIEGEQLPPGANEMILSAAAAFPLDCYAPGVQVQSYLGGSVTGEIPPPPLTTTTMHTTTIINSGNGNFPQQILPQRHPPPLPTAFSEAAAAAGLVPPSGAPPTSDSGTQKSSQQKQPVSTTTKATSTGKMQAQTQTLPVSAAGKDKAQVQPPPGPLPPAKTPTATQQLSAAAQPKKQTAKRTRPFSQGPGGGHAPGSCPNNNKLCSGGSHAAVGTQTPAAAGTAATAAPGDKPKKDLDVDSATDSNGETSLSIAAGQGHYEVVEFLLSRSAHIGKELGYGQD